jgi:pyruvate/2-oxoglutarate dehydrogenase complex dihydrolipoamide acyltransferase (E2) component
LTNIVDVKVPDIGDFKDVPIIEITVKPGDVVKIDDPLLTLESDKASMEVPSPSAGTVKEVLVKVGDRVGKDKLIVRLEGGDVPSAAQAAPAVMHQQEAAEPPPGAAPAPAPQKSGGPAIADFSGPHASPAIRRLARELDIDLNAIKGTGEKGRVTKEDLKASLGAGAKGSSTGAPAGTMIQITRGVSSCRTTSSRSFAGAAPSFWYFVTTAGSRSNATTECPCCMRRSTMLPPIRPRPIIPSCIRSLPLALPPCVLRDGVLRTPPQDDENLF